MSEAWRPVVGYEGFYEVSDAGRLRSVTRGVRGANNSVRVMPQRELRLWAGAKGYLCADLWRDNRSRKTRVHRLVLEAFVGPCPDGMVGCHNDDDPKNNHLSNLRWDTYAENSLDVTRNGHSVNANKTHCPRGHLYDAENTYFMNPKAGRSCRRCRVEMQPVRNEAQRRRRAARSKEATS